MRVSQALMIAAIFVISSPGVSASDQMKADEHFIEANGVRLHVSEKVLGEAAGKPIVVLAHGSATAGPESFDVQVEGRPRQGEPDFSLMDYLAREGFDVFAADVRGFGRSTHPDTGVTTQEAAQDLDAVIDDVLKMRGAAKVHVVAWSWGTQYAGLEVMAHPEKIARYVSYAQMHPNSPDVIKRRERLEEFRKGPYITIPEPAWKKRFTSMTPDAVNDAGAVETYARGAFAVEKTTPTGPQIDMTTRLPLVDPARINVPTMMIHGQYDDVADTRGLLAFFEALNTPEKRYVIVPDAGHMAHLQAGRGILQRAIADFLKR